MLYLLLAAIQLASASTSNPTTLSGGEDFTCSITDFGCGIQCSGNEDGTGRLGRGSLTVGDYAPTCVEGTQEKNWDKISCSIDTCIALADDGTVVGWGDNTHGQLSAGLNEVSIPVATILQDANNRLIDGVAATGVDIAMAATHSVVLTEERLLTGGNGMGVGFCPLTETPRANTLYPVPGAHKDYGVKWSNSSLECTGWSIPWVTDLTCRPKEPNAVAASDYATTFSYQPSGSSNNKLESFGQYDQLGNDLFYSVGCPSDRVNTSEPVCISTTGSSCTTSDLESQEKIIAQLKTFMSIEGGKAYVWGNILDDQDGDGSLLPANTLPIESFTANPRGDYIEDVALLDGSAYVLVRTPWGDREIWGAGKNKHDTFGTVVPVGSYSGGWVQIHSGLTSTVSIAGTHTSLYFQDNLGNWKGVGENANGQIVYGGASSITTPTTISNYGGTAPPPTYPEFDPAYVYNTSLAGGGTDFSLEIINQTGCGFVATGIQTDLNILGEDPPFSVGTPISNCVDYPAGVSMWVDVKCGGNACLLTDISGYLWAYGESDVLPLDDLPTILPDGIALTQVTHPDGQPVVVSGSDMSTFSAAAIVDGGFFTANHDTYRGDCLSSPGTDQEEFQYGHLGAQSAIRYSSYGATASTSNPTHQALDIRFPLITENGAGLVEKNGYINGYGDLDSDGVYGSMDSTTDYCFADAPSRDGCLRTGWSSETCSSTKVHGITMAVTHDDFAVYADSTDVYVAGFLPKDTEGQGASPDVDKSVLVQAYTVDRSIYPIGTIIEIAATTESVFALIDIDGTGSGTATNIVHWGREFDGVSGSSYTTAALPLKDSGTTITDAEHIGASEYTFSYITGTEVCRVGDNSMKAVDIFSSSTYIENPSCTLLSSLP